MIRCFDVGKFCSTPSASEIHQREMFLRFFEELAYAINTSSLDKEKVCYYFSYYAIAASLMGEKFVEDYNDGCWEEFQKFVKEMRKMAKACECFEIPNVRNKFPNGCPFKKYISGECYMRAVSCRYSQ